MIGRGPVAARLREELDLWYGILREFKRRVYWRIETDEIHKMVRRGDVMLWIEAHVGSCYTRGLVLIGPWAIFSIIPVDKSGLLITDDTGRDIITFRTIRRQQRPFPR